MSFRVKPGQGASPPANSEAGALDEQPPGELQQAAVASAAPWSGPLKAVANALAKAEALFAVQGAAAMGVPLSNATAEDWAATASRADQALFGTSSEMVVNETQAPDTTDSKSALSRRFGFVDFQRFKGLAKRREPQKMSYTQRAIASVSLERVNDELAKRTASNLTVSDFGLDSVNLHYGKQVGSKAAELIRDVNAALFTGAVHDLIDVMKGMNTSEWDTAERYHEPEIFETENRVYTQGEALVGFSNESRVGHYGREVSRAMVDLNNVLFKALEPISRHMDDERLRPGVLKSVMGVHTFQSTAD